MGINTSAFLFCAAVRRGDIARMRTMRGVIGFDVNALVPNNRGELSFRMGDPVYGGGAATALCYAAEKGNLAVVEELLAVPGIDVNKSTMVTRSTPLLLAAKHGHLSIVKALLAVPGIDVNCPNYVRETPLWIAAALGFVNIVKALLGTSGIDVNKADYKGDTPLYAATMYRTTAVVKALLGHPGIDVNKANSVGDFPLFTALSWGWIDGDGDGIGIELFDALLAAPGIDVNQETADRDRQTALVYASFYGCLPAVQRLLAAPGIDVNVTGNGSTALIAAARRDNLEVVKALLAIPGIDVNKATNIGETALYAAASRGYTRIVKVLLAAPGIDLTAPTTFQKSVIEHADELAFTTQILTLIFTKSGLSHPLMRTAENQPLPTFIASQLLEFELSKSGTCPIAYTPLERGASAVMSCGHVFSREGLEMAFEVTPDMCPLCRKKGVACDV